MHMTAPLPLHTPLNPPCVWTTFNVFYIFQLPCRTGPQTTHSRVNEEQIKVCLIQISRYRFSLVIAGLTKILQKINEMVSILVLFYQYSWGVQVLEIQIFQPKLNLSVWKTIFSETKSKQCLSLDLCLVVL